MLLQIISFILRYIPFWAIPTMILAGQNGYSFWLKSMKKLFLICVIFFFSAKQVSSELRSRSGGTSNEEMDSELEKQGV